MKKIKIPKNPRMLVYWYHRGTYEDSIWIWYKNDKGKLMLTGIYADGTDCLPTIFVYSEIERRANAIDPSYYTLIHAE